MENTVKKLRSVIDNVDTLLMKLLNKRFKISRQLQKIKKHPVSYSPARENEILSKCPCGDTLRIYRTLLKQSRIFSENIKWLFINSGNKTADTLALKHFDEIFGGHDKLKFYDSPSELKIPARSPAVIITAGNIGNSLGCDIEKKLFKYCEYKEKKRAVFGFYSTVAPLFECDLNVTVNL